MRNLNFFIICVIALCISSCTPRPNELRIALNPWPGYELLYLAKQKGFFAEQGLNIKFVQIASLSDGLHAFNSGYVDGMASTSIEVIQAAKLGHRTLVPVLVTDYSNGGDLIVAHPSVKTLAQLKNKRIGLELNSLGMYVLSLALEKAGLSFNDVTVVNVEQLDGERALAEGKIDAFVTYPPTSITLTRTYTTLFTSRDAPKEILDMLSVDLKKIDNLPEFKQKLHTAWQQAITYTQANKESAYRLMASRENISANAFASAIENDLQLLNNHEQSSIIANLDQHFIKTCQVLSLQKNQSINCTTALAHIELAK